MYMSDTLSPLRLCRSRLGGAWMHAGSMCLCVCVCVGGGVADTMDRCAYAHARTHAEMCG